MLKSASKVASSAAASASRAVIIGAGGALGQAALHHFEKLGWETVGVEMGSSNEAFKNKVRFSKFTPWQEQMTMLEEHLADSGPVDAVVCASGGWTGGGAGDKPEALVTAVHQMTSVCLEPAITAAHIACKLLTPTGLLVLVGSEAAVHPTPGMLAYGMAKAATHHLLVSVSPAAGSASSAETEKSPNTIPPQARAIGILPKVLDTPNNRKWMSQGADTSTWTPLEEVAGKIAEWAQAQAQQREGKGAGAAAAPLMVPSSGSLVVPETAGGKTVWRVLPGLYAAAASPQLS